jgi:hypothetical protein
MSRWVLLAEGWFIISLQVSLIMMTDVAVRSQATVLILARRAGELNLAYGWEGPLYRCRQLRKGFVSILVGTCIVWAVRLYYRF